MCTRLLTEATRGRKRGHFRQCDGLRKPHHVIWKKAHPLETCPQERLQLYICSPQWQSSCCVIGEYSCTAYDRCSSLEQISHLRQVTTDMSLMWKRSENLINHKVRNKKLKQILYLFFTCETVMLKTVNGSPGISYLSKYLWRESSGSKGHEWCRYIVTLSNPFSELNVKRPQNSIEN